MVLRESRTAGRRGSLGARAIGGGSAGLNDRTGLVRIGMIEFVPYLVVAAGVLFVESHDIDHGLGMFFLFFLGDTVLLQQSLPFLGKAGELACLVVIAYMSDMDGIFRGGNFDASRGA